MNVFPFRRSQSPNRSQNGNEHMEASYYMKREDGAVRCDLCPHRCIIPDGKYGRCRIRENRSGTLVATGYGRVVSLTVDPIEKKPL